MRRAARVDGNHPEIVAALRSEGCTVVDTSGVGDGFPDLLIGINGCTVLMEIKNGALSPSKRKLTEDQQRFHASWTGGPLCIVYDVQGALNAVRTAKA